MSGKDYSVIRLPLSIGAVLLVRRLFRAGRCTEK